MGQERFAGESAVNLEQKCLCVLVLDVSGSMRGNPIQALNDGLGSFWKDIKSGEGKNQIEVAIIKYDQDVQIIREPKLLDNNESAPTLSERGSTTNTVTALYEAIKLVDDRKAFYKATGQTYYRPWIILMTDGEPYPYVDNDVAEISKIVKTDVEAKHYMIVGLGVGNANMDILKRMTNNTALPLQGTKFKDFFEWLGNSMETISQSKEGDKIDLTSGMSQFMGYQI